MRTSKWCPQCQTTKPADEYHRNRGQVDGLATTCKPCSSSLKKRSREKRKAEKAKEAIAPLLRLLAHLEDRCDLDPCPECGTRLWGSFDGQKCDICDLILATGNLGPLPRWDHGLPDDSIAAEVEGAPTT